MPIKIISPKVARISWLSDLLFDSDSDHELRILRSSPGLGSELDVEPVYDSLPLSQSLSPSTPLLPQKIITRYIRLLVYNLDYTNCVWRIPNSISWLCHPAISNFPANLSIIGFLILAERQS